MRSRRVMVITGARKGIGRYLAERYLLAGYVVHGCSRQESDLAHPDYVHHRCDITDEDSVERVVREIRERSGTIDVLLNNAGVASMNHALLTPGSSVQALMQTNYFGTYVFCREAAKVMQRARRGRIVNFTSVAVPLSLEGEAAYAASKAAVECLTRIIAKEFGRYGITVNAVGPNPIATDLIAHVAKDKITQILARQAVPRMGTFDDVANAVNFFIAPESELITGQVLYLGGV